MMVQRIKKLLVANRGEIAVRIQRSASEMGIRTVAIFSDMDRSAPHVLYADEAYQLHGSLSRETYLDIEKIIEVANSSRCDAIHPGYGFLSENPEFAEATTSAGLIFVGPPASAMRQMGSKTQARNLMQKANVPIVPGTTIPVVGYDAARQAARKVNFPVLIKAVHGGGGKGMRIVEAESSLKSLLGQAQSESLKAFGSDEVFIEKYLSHPRHIEIQVLADEHGNVIHLGERECSVQRRHQKVIEECPSSGLKTELREAMGRAAVNAAKECGYVSAGTIEFLVEGDSFYFLEMNTRLQVEHPVTECVYSIDLVKEQIRIAQGEKLTMKQGDVIPRGHAIECRIYAEDPFNSFLPSTGRILEYAPSGGFGIRNDSGIALGTDIVHFYDPLLAKLVAWGSDRTEARLRMMRALSEYKISGVSTTIPFCHFVISHPEFEEGKYDIHFVEKYFHPQSLTNPHEIELAASLIAASLYQKEFGIVKHVIESASSSQRWKSNRFDE